jgi:hypothetical protein
MTFTPKLLQQGASGASGYQISRSLRFRSSNSAYMSRTPSVAGNRKTWTWSGWVKRGSLGSNAALFSVSTGAGAYQQTALYFTSDNLRFYSDLTISADVRTSAVYRDTSAWYHFVCAFDTTQATASDRVKIYVNGVLQTALSSTTYPTQSTDGQINNTSYAFEISRSNGATFLNDYLAEVNFIDGQALTPSSFGSTNSQTGVWQPKKFTGTYGTNGFYVNFSDNSNTTAATLGKDYSGNGNNWTPNNFSLTAGSTYDSMNDVPTLTSRTASNYAVMNPLDKNDYTVSNGNLQVVMNGTSSTSGMRASIAVASGKFYWEATRVGWNVNEAIGVATTTSPLTGLSLQTNGTCVCYWGSAIYQNGVSVQSGLGGTSDGDVIGIALNMDALTVQFYRNGSAIGTAVSLSAGLWTASHGSETSGYSASCTTAYKFGQQPFTYTAPTGFNALNTYNLPTPTIAQGNKYMDASIYTGNGTSQSLTLGFQSDFTWFKARNIGYSSILTNSVTGGSNYLVSSSIADEQGGQSLVTSWTSTGVNVGSWIAVNESTITYVAWNWKAGGTAVTNTSGTISSQVSANPTSGFSVLTYTGTGSNATVGHGIGVAPSMVIVKNRTSGSGDVWLVQHSSLGPTKYIILNRTDVVGTASTPWNNTAPTSSVFSIGTLADVNTSTNIYVAYCFAAIAGYSAFGSYTGNGSTDGPFIYTGFRPRFILYKNTSNVFDWQMVDTSRDTYNASGLVLQPNATNAEGDGRPQLDILSNGFKLKATTSATNQSGSTFIYMAFAENPFKYALAR